VYTLPFESPYKVYILDEAHMLSKGAWNAFLKTLEEPPAHTVFILATTELEKVPETVQSRCQVFTFKKPTRAELAKVVAAVAKKEGFQTEPAAADLVALLADGSYRDALSVLERVAGSSSDKQLTRVEVENATGAPKHELVAKLAAALSAGSADEALTAIRKAADSGIDMKLYLSLVLDYLRAVLLVRHAPALRKEFAEELGTDAYGEVEKLASDTGSKIAHETLKAFLDAAARMRYASVPALPLELAVLEILSRSE
jgi:DNA polymerase-3 subunit gamma/tau